LAVRVRVELAVVVEPVVRAGLVALAAPVAAVELEHDLVVVELELVPAVAVRERDHLAAQRRTKLATAAHHRGQVPVPRRVEDLAVAAETTREPAATEAGIAWVAAV
jgi:hypothetical protein